MKITVNKFGGGFDGKKCYVHARVASVNENYHFMTMQYLDVSGVDSVYPLVYLENFGSDWTEPKDVDTVKEDENGNVSLLCDATPIYHDATEKIVIYGYVVTYQQDRITAVNMDKYYIGYYVFDIKTKNISELKRVEIPQTYPTGMTVASAQSVIDDNGNILMPVEIFSTEKFHISTAVARFLFDGEKLEFFSISNVLQCSAPRGLYEGSLIKLNSKYYLTMRNDEHGYFSVSGDGEHFFEAQIWRWDSGEILENYNTQQHWLTLGERLYLVYTRKAENNGHVFRHRAPLFIAEVDTEKMCLIKDTEKIAVPERGARLGNFGANQINKNKAFITVGEWMQFEGRGKYGEQYGSDNSIFVTAIEKN